MATRPTRTVRRGSPEGERVEGPRPVATPNTKARSTGRWARTMVKVWITRSRTTRGWEIVNFTGRAGGESRGVVDLLAIRKDHRTGLFPRGDLFDLVLIQVKGGTAAAPTAQDVERLRAVADHYHVRLVVLAEWKRGTAPVFWTLRPAEEVAAGETPWSRSTASEIFG